MEIITKLAPVALFYIMFSLGLQCKFSDFKKVLTNPKNLIIGLSSQMIILPIIGLLFAYFLPISQNYKIGIVLITCVPSTVASNYLTKIINGNIYLSISMTAISSLISFISIPLILSKVVPALGLMNVIKFDLSFSKMSALLFIISTIPILLGILFNSKFNNFSKKVVTFFNRSSIIIFICIFFIAWYSEFETSIKAYKELFWVLVMLSSSILVYVNILVKVLNVNTKDSKTIITETFIQNGAMAIIVGSTIFGLGTGYLFLVAIYSLFQYKVFFVWYLLDKKLNKFV